MARFRCSVLAVLAGTLALAGCSGGSDDGGTGMVAATPDAPASLEVTDGRLGDATTVGPDEDQRDLSPGGRLDPGASEDHQRRDGVGAGAACAGADLVSAPAAMPQIAAATLCLVNGERADRGLVALTLNARLGSAATAYAQDLIDGSYFSHTGRNGSSMLSRVKRTGYLTGANGWRVGENLAWGTGGLATAGAITAAWMNSPGHRANILKPQYREVGIGVVPGNPAKPDGAGATYVTEFGAVPPRRAASRTSSSRRARAARAKRRAAAAAARATLNG